MHCLNVDQNVLQTRAPFPNSCSRFYFARVLPFVSVKYVLFLVSLDNFLRNKIICIIILLSFILSAFLEELDSNSHFLFRV